MEAEVGSCAPPGNDEGTRWVGREGGRDRVSRD